MIPVPPRSRPRSFGKNSRFEICEGRSRRFRTPRFREWRGQNGYLITSPTSRGAYSAGLELLTAGPLYGCEMLEAMIAASLSLAIQRA